MFSSYFRSTVRVTDGFQSVFEYLNRLSPEDAVEVLWQTRHKKVLRYQVLPEIVPGNIPGYQAVVKSYEEKRFFRYLFRASLAYREWFGYRNAASCGIPAAKVLAAAEERCFLYLKRSLFITEYVACSGDGDDFRTGGCRKDESALALEFARKNLAFLAKLHRSGFVHGGFTPRNELYILKPYSEKKPDDCLDVVWIDLATCQKCSVIKRKKLQRSEMKRFLSLMEFSPEVREKLQNFYFEELEKK